MRFPLVIRSSRLGTFFFLMSFSFYFNFFTMKEAYNETILVFLYKDEPSFLHRSLLKTFKVHLLNNYLFVRISLANPFRLFRPSISLSNINYINKSLLLILVRPLFLFFLHWKSDKSIILYFIIFNLYARVKVHNW